MIGKACGSKKVFCPQPLGTISQDQTICPRCRQGLPELISEKSQLQTVLVEGFVFSTTRHMAYIETN